MTFFELRGIPDSFFVTCPLTVFATLDSVGVALVVTSLLNITEMSL